MTVKKAMQRTNKFNSIKIRITQNRPFILSHFLFTSIRFQINKIDRALKPSTKTHNPYDLYSFNPLTFPVMNNGKIIIRKMVNPQ